MSRLPLALAGLMMVATPAAADVTPREVWDGWLAKLEEEGAEVVTEAVDETGDGLVIRGLSLTSGDEEDGSYSLEIDEIALTENDDGTVDVSVSPEYPVVLSGSDDGTTEETHLRVRHPQLEMTISDEDGMRQHAFAAPEIEVVIEEVLEDGEPLDVEGELLFHEAAGHYDIGEAGEGRSAFAAARISFDLSGTESDTGEDYAATVDVEGFDSSNVLQIVGAEPARAARQLPEGGSIDGSFSTESTSFRFESSGTDEVAAFSGTLGPGQTQLDLSADGLGYASEGQDLALTFSGSSMPLPEVSLHIDRTNLGFEAPLLESEEPQPYAFSISLLDVALDDGLWNMVDPAGILPRDPGSIVLDLSGEMEMDRDVEASTADDAGGEIRSVELNTARVAFADAEADATGELTLQESPLGTTLPVGQIEVTLTGVARLIDRLVQAGILPQEQAMGTRMMLNMFARPGEIEGELLSTVRFTEDGHVFVNDQQVR